MEKDISIETSHSKHLTVREVAEMLHLSTDAIYRYVERSEIGHFKIGNRIRISRSHLDSFLVAHEVIRNAGDDRSGK